MQFKVDAPHKILGLVGFYYSTLHSFLCIIVEELKALKETE
jgi:hypothetical protein